MCKSNKSIPPQKSIEIDGIELPYLLRHMANIVYNNNLKTGADLSEAVQLVIEHYKEYGVWTGGVGEGSLEHWVTSKREFEYTGM